MQPDRPSRDAASYRERAHAFVAEVYGAISGRLLVGVARHAAEARDPVTVWRAQQIVTRGVEVGWCDESKDSGKVVAGRETTVADEIVAEIKRRVEADRG